MLYNSKQDNTQKVDKMNTNLEGIIFEHNDNNNFELFRCTDTKDFYITQLTFGITSKISKQEAFKLCESSNWAASDYQGFFPEFNATTKEWE